MAVLSRLRVAAPWLKRHLASSRPFGSAAAPQIQYDEYYGYEVHHGNLTMTMEDADGAQSERGVHWVILGDPMARKNLYAERLSKLLDVPHISMGSLLRQELHPPSPLYKQIASSVNQGKLVPEDVIFALLSKRLEEESCRGETGFILDGIPRTRTQAEILDQIADIDLVVNLKCTDDCSALGNGIYPTSREVLNMGSFTGLNISLQSRDNHMEPFTTHAEGVWKEKLRAYAEQCKPLEDYYKKQRKLVDFQVAGAPGETWQGLLAALHLQHMNTVGLSQKLVA